MELLDFPLKKIVFTGGWAILALLVLGNVWHVDINQVLTSEHGAIFTGSSQSNLVNHKGASWNLDRVHNLLQRCRIARGPCQGDTVDHKKVSQTHTF